MDVNEALEMAIPLGRSQIILLIATALMNMETGFSILSNVFLASTPPYHCAPSNLSFDLDEGVPIDTAGKFETCTEYAYPGTDNNETQDCGRWTFNTEVAGNTIVSDWSLVCGKDFLPGLAQTIILAGFATGSLVGGVVADRYGRRITIIVSLFFFNAIGLSISLVQSYVAFAILRFLLGAVFKSVRIPIMNLLFESLIPRHRAFFGVIPTAMSSVGLMVMAGIAYLVRDWRYLNLVLMIPSIIMMTFVWLLPESVRWLQSQGRAEEAEATIQKIASFNGVKSFPSPALNTAEDIPAVTSNQNSGEAEGNKGLKTLFELVRQPTLTVTLVLCCNWTTTGLTYFGFALSTGQLAGNPYLNFFISSSADVIALVSVTFILRRFGTMRTLIFGFAMSSAVMVGVIAVSYSGNDSTASRVLMVIFSFLGRFFICFAAQPTILMMSDLFPTPVRNVGTAIVHLIGNLGSIIAPQLLYVNKYISNFSSFVMLVACVLSGFLSLLLPETVGFKQPETRDDLQELFDANRLINCGGGRRRRSSEDAGEKCEMK